MRGGVRKSGVKNNQPGAARLAVDNALRMRIEIMTRFEVGTDEQNYFRVCMSRTWSIEPHPQLITFAGSGRTNVRVRVVTVNSPRGQNTFGEAVFTGTSDVIHDLVAPIFDDGFPNSCRQIVERFIPRDALPLAFTTLA